MALPTDAGGQMTAIMYAAGGIGLAATQLEARFCCNLTEVLAKPLKSPNINIFHNIPYANHGCVGAGQVERGSQRRLDDFGDRGRLLPCPISRAELGHIISVLVMSQPRAQDMPSQRSTGPERAVVQDSRQERDIKGGQHAGKHQPSDPVSRHSI